MCRAQVTPSAVALAPASATALENEYLRSAVSRQPMSAVFEAGRWRGNFLADRMTGNG
jgi:hypothetical protein